MLEKHIGPAEPRREVRWYKFCSCCRSRLSPTSLVFAYWLHLCSSIPALLLLQCRCSWLCMSVLHIHRVGDAGRSCFIGNPRAMLYCFFLRKWRRWWRQAGSLSPPRMLLFTSQFPHFHLSLLVQVSLLSAFRLFYIDCHSRVRSTCHTSLVLLLPSLPWTSTQLYEWALNLRPFPKFWIQNNLDTTNSFCGRGHLTFLCRYVWWDEQTPFHVTELRVSEAFLSLSFLTGGISLLVLGGTMGY